jgi:LPS sulfotransferase NodH
LRAVAGKDDIRRSLFICFVPRAGSLYLAGLLASSGVAGVPMEVFNSPLEAENRREHGIETDAEYFDWVRATSVTPNGSFGCKLTYLALKDVLARLRRIHHTRLSDVPLLARAFPNPVFVWLRRRNALAQAVSWARALQTDQWVSPRAAKADPAFDYDLIKKQLAAIRSQEAAWIRWFGKNDIADLQVFYEDALVDPHQEVERVLGTLGVEMPAGVELRPYWWAERQSDELNAEWIDRYRARASEERAFGRYLSRLAWLLRGTG